jgi:hypothetical protein
MTMSALSRAMIATLLLLHSDGVDGRVSHGAPFRRGTPARPALTDREGKRLHLPGSANCTTHWYDQVTDHFSYAPPPAGYSPTFRERYFVCHNGVNPATAKAIWFYCGNEVCCPLQLLCSSQPSTVCQGRVVKVCTVCTVRSCSVSGCSGLHSSSSPMQHRLPERGAIFRI